MHRSRLRDPVVRGAAPLRPELRGADAGPEHAGASAAEAVVDSVDRAMKELVGLGAVSVEHRREGTRRLTNRYLVRTLAEKGGPQRCSHPSSFRRNSGS